MLTPFGKALRQLRVEKDLKLIDVAAVVGVSSAFISALETGRKSIPDGFLSKLRRSLNLNDKEANTLRRARDRTRDEVSVDMLPGDDRELVAAFARHIEEVPPDLLEKLRGKVLKSISGEHPFARKRRGLAVAPKSTEALRDISEMVRGAFADADGIKFPIMDVLDSRLSKIFSDYQLVVLEEEEMGELEGLVIAGDPVLRLRNDVYEAACNDDGRARFTACHELGHYLLHRKVAMARTRDVEPIYEDSEWQADVFAGALLMSRQHAMQFESVEEAARECGMSPTAARYQLKKYGRTV
jgi:Zn-dependent peptidase ImmA (M78 family)/transcriptional regulator with XRE-family HTH domain